MNTWLTYLLIDLSFLISISLTYWVYKKVVLKKLPSIPSAEPIVKEPLLPVTSSSSDYSPPMVYKKRKHGSESSVRPSKNRIPSESSAITSPLFRVNIEQPAAETVTKLFSSDAQTPRHVTFVSPDSQANLSQQVLKTILKREHQLDSVISMLFFIS